MKSWEERHKVWLFFSQLSEKQTQTDDIIPYGSPFFCSACGKPIPITFNEGILQEDPTKFIILRCDHIFCIGCIQQFAQSQIQNEDNFFLRCPLCCNPLNDQEVNTIDPNYSSILDERFLRQQGDVVTCPRCKNSFILEPGQMDPNILDSEGEKYRPEAIESYRKYRVTCSICQTNFCANCKMIPYHEALTCEEKKLFDEDIFCRFCTLFPPVGGIKNDVCHRVCWHEKCRECLKDACDHVCECGHACCGEKGEVNHFGCSLCQMERSFCFYCKQSCTNSPSVVMRCGHPVHKICLKKLYENLDDTKRLIIPRCTFSEGCDQIPYHDCVRDLAQKWVDYASKIKEITEMRMKIEDTQNEPDHVKNQDDPDYFGKPEKYARDFFVFYVCEKCHQPYYAGHKDCGAAEQENEVDNGPRQCMRCNRELMSTICQKHGEVGMIYKCMFCCSPSIWLCYNNTTYFCDNCHRRAGQVENGPFPQCDGHCKFAPHPANGQRVFTGYCVLCEQEKENQMLHK